MINRLMLRLAAVNALLPQPGEASPTIAGESVFDSRLDDIEFDGDAIEIPLLIVYTEDDEMVLQDRGQGSGAFERHIILRIEMALGSFSASTTDGVKRVTYGLPTTDAELEALLDIFEASVWRTIMHPVRPASVALQEMVVQWDTWHSVASRTVDSNNRLAARTITARCRVHPDCRPGTSLLPIAKSDALPVFHDAPYLNPLIAALAKDPKNAGLMSMLREVAGGGPQIQVPQFLRMGTRAALVTPKDPALAAILHRTGSLPVNVQAVWTVPTAF